MGIIPSCCRPSAADVITPDAESRRCQQMEAAERRREAEAARGLKAPDRVLRAERMQQEIEKLEQEQAHAKDGGAPLRWTTK